jgi:hypothetical protein
MYAQQSSKTQFCSHCKSIGKTYAEYSSHFVRKTPDTNSRLTCPELLKNICKNCPAPNHTWNRCPLAAKEAKKFQYNSTNVAPAPKPAPRPAAPNKVVKNRFSGLDDEEEQDQIFDSNQLVGLTPEDQKQCIGEEIYAKVFVNNQARAGLITGMLLDFDISDLVIMFNTPEIFNSRIEEANHVIDIAV